MALYVMEKQLLRKGADAKFIILITDSSGTPVEPDNCDLWFQLYTSRTKRLVRERKRGEAFPPGMKIEGNDIVLSLDAPGFTVGRLFVRFRTRVYDASFPDGFYDFTSGEVPTDVFVVK